MEGVMECFPTNILNGEVYTCKLVFVFIIIIIINNLGEKKKAGEGTINDYRATVNKNVFFLLLLFYGSLFGSSLALKETSMTSYFNK